MADDVNAYLSNRDFQESLKMSTIFQELSTVLAVLLVKIKSSLCRVSNTRRCNCNTFVRRRNKNGNNLKIKRPKDYAEPANGDSEKALPVVDLISSTVDSPCKIFIGGIPSLLSSDKVKEIVTASGQLKACHLEVETNKSFAFEYVD